MKQFKKIASLVMALVMVFAMSVTAFAEGSGSITISNVTKDQTYSVYKIFDANPGEGNTISYTANETQKNYFTETDGSEPFTFTLNSSGTFNVGVKEGYNDETVINYLKNKLIQENVDDDGKKTASLKSDANGVATLKETKSANDITDGSTNLVFDNLEYGYYLIISSLGATVTIDSTNKDVTVIDKNQSGPSNLEKKIAQKEAVDGLTAWGKTSDGDFGDIVTYRVTLNTTNYDGEKVINKYYFKDTIAPGMAYVENSVKVYVQPTDVISDSTPIDSSKYSFEINNTEHTLTLNIPWAIVTKANSETGQEFNAEFYYSSPNKITIEYQAKILNSANIGPEEGNKNTVTYTYTTDTDNETPGDDKYTEEDETTTYVYALALNKVDTEGKPLSGVEFEVRKGNENGELIWVVPVKDADGNVVKGRYEYAGDAAVNEGTRPQDATTTVVSGDGLIIIKGVDKSSYFIKETKALPGYNVLETSKEITATEVGSSTEKVTKEVYLDDKGNIVDQKTDKTITVVSKDLNVAAASIVVVNKQGNLLPSTGGIGTTIFYVVGAILVIGAGVLLVAKKRMSNR